MFSAYHIPIAMEGDSMGLLAVNQYNFSPQYTYCVMLPQKKGKSESRLFSLEIRTQICVSGTIMAKKWYSFFLCDQRDQN
jgi:hypothetical protein